MSQISAVLGEMDFFNIHRLLRCTPGNGTGAARLVAWKSLAGRQPTSIAIGVERTTFRAEVAPAEARLSRRTFSTTISSREKRLVRFLSWNAIAAALNSKNAARTLIGKAALELSWFGEAEGHFPAIWSSGFPTRSLWITPMVEWKSSSVLGVVATLESGTHREHLIVPFVSFVGEKQPTSIAIGWSEQARGGNRTR